MQPSTHLAIDRRLCGTPTSLSQGRAVLELVTVSEMAADARGLVHGGFVFGLADYAAMLAINEPNVVLGSAEVRLLAPVRLGDVLSAEAELLPSEGKKQRVEVTVSRKPPDGTGESERVFFGTFVCFVPSVHVLEARASRAQEKAAP
jgi:acyl-coenzyme A thioesterase PaaI-like protein